MASRFVITARRSCAITKSAIASFGIVIFCASSDVIALDACWDDNPITRRIDKLADLPDEIQMLLGKQARSIAEKGAPFNSSDTFEFGRPGQRFVTAVMNERCATVTIEQGGFALSVKYRNFEKSNDHWRSIDKP